MKITIETEKDRNIDVNVKLGKDSERKGFTPDLQRQREGI